MTKMKFHRVRIEALSPLILTSMSHSTVMTDTKTSISGTILRGVFAKRYIACQGLGKDAQRDPAFRHLFFGGLRFVDANPVAEGLRSIVLPLSLQKEKATDGKALPAIQDLLKESAPKLGCKSLRGYAAVTENGKIVPASVRTSIALHMSRSAAGERLVGSSRDGGIFNYESIDAGQVFEGAIFGTEEDLQALFAGCQLEDGTLHARIGRSRFTQYGSVRMTCSAMEDEKAAIDENLQDGKLFLRFDTPFLPRIEQNGVLDDATGALTILLARMGERFSIGKVYAASAEVENFVGIWGMKQPRLYGLSAGTVFALEKDGAWTAEDKERLSNLLADGLGQRRQEGFGQLRIWPKQKMQLAAPATEAPKAVPMDATIRTQVQRILDRKRMEQLRLYAYEDAGKMHGLGGKTHFFARLLAMLEQAHGEHTEARFQEMLQKESHHDDGKIRARDRSETPLVRHLHAIDLGKTSLYDIFESGKMPYAEGRSWLEDLGDRTPELLREVGLSEADFPLDGEAFYTYWQQVFRSARKRAANDQRRDVE